MDGDRMYTMLLAHLVAALVGPVLVRAMGRNAFFLLALAPGPPRSGLPPSNPGHLAKPPLKFWAPGSPTSATNLPSRLDPLTGLLRRTPTASGRPCRRTG